MHRVTERQPHVHPGSCRKGKCDADRRQAAPWAGSLVGAAILSLYLVKPRAVIRIRCFDKDIHRQEPSQHSMVPVMVVMVKPRAQREIPG